MICVLDIPIVRCGRPADTRVAAPPRSGQSNGKKNYVVTGRKRPQADVHIAAFSALKANLFMILNASMALELRPDDALARDTSVILYTGPEIQQGVCEAWLESKGAAL